MVAESVAESDLTPIQYGAMVYLSRDTGEPGIEQNGLAGRLGCDRNTASVLVEQLVKKGLVDRRVSDTDRRARRLWLTPKGEKLYGRLRPKNLAANARILAPLSVAERELLLDLLVRVIEGNWEHARPGTGRRPRNSLAKSKYA